MHTTEPDLVPRLWSAARFMFARMRAAIGEAATIAARVVLSDEERRAIRKWLAPLEAMARKVVLIHAIALLEQEQGDTPANAARAMQAPAAEMRVCHPASAPPALTLIALPPAPVRILTHAEAPPTAPPRQHARAPALRLWPRQSAAGPRVRDIGPERFVHEIQRDRAHLALARHLDAARRNPLPEPQRLARRIEALARLLQRPLAAARRLARILRAKPLLALKLSLKRAPRTNVYPDPEYDLANDRVVQDAWDFNAKRRLDTS